MVSMPEAAPPVDGVLLRAREAVAQRVQALDLGLVGAGLVHA
jgi:hypothetical protein